MRLLVIDGEKTKDITINVGKKDILVLQTDEVFTNEQISRIAQQARDALEGESQVLILERGIKIKLLKFEDEALEEYENITSNVTSNIILDKEVVNQIRKQVENVYIEADDGRCKI